MVRVKICCIKNFEEADMAISCGANALGIVGPMPTGPGTINPILAGKISEYISNRANSFYLTSKTDLNKILQEYEVVKSSHIQLTDSTSAITRRNLKDQFPHLKIVQVVHVLDNSSLDTARELEEESDYLLLDSGSPGKSRKELGGTGRVHNWDISKKIVRNAKIPVYLAGGLNAKNIISAIEHVDPYGIDLCSGIRTNDKLDKEKIRSFFNILESMD